MQLVLASTSPRRREILSLLDVYFEVVAPDYEETVIPERDALSEVMDFAVGKAQSVACRYADAYVLGSDTMIAIEHHKIGKPRDAADAVAILQTLSGKTHSILTSVAIVDTNNNTVFRHLDEVIVRMRDYTLAEAKEYVASGECFDKAGAYSIQGLGRELIESIDGDYLAAVGLPLKPIAEYLLNRGQKIPRDVNVLYETKAFMNWASF